MVNFAVKSNAVDFLGTVSGYKEMEDTGVFVRRTDDILSLLIPGCDEAMEISINL